MTRREDLPFTIFCIVCRGETVAFKHARRRHDGTRIRSHDLPDGPKLFGVNVCMCCNTHYDAPLPDWWNEPYMLEDDDDGGRGSGVLPVAS